MREAIILAGGLGTRLRSEVPYLPKSMAPIGSKPFLEILLNSLANKGFNRIIFSLGYMAESISSYFGSRFLGMDLHYVVEASPLGTGGGVRLALTKVLSSNVFILNGDTFVDIEIEALEDFYALDSSSLIVGKYVQDTGRYGTISQVDGYITGFREKEKNGPGLINTGCYLLSKNQLDAYPLYVHFSLERDFFPSAIAREGVKIFETKNIFIDIGVPEDYRRAQSVLVSY